MKINWLLSSVIILVGVVILGLIFSVSSLVLFMSDAYFLISAILLIIGLSGWILKNGTFDFFHYSLNRAKHALFTRQKLPDKRDNQPVDQEKLQRLSHSISPAYTSFIKTGALILAASFLCTLIYSFFIN